MNPYTGPNYSGLFEYHVTVKSVDVELLTTIAETNKAKLDLIELAQGNHMVQPMITGFCKGTVQQAYDKAFNVAAQLEELDLKVTRVKLEAALVNELLPISDQDSLQHPNSNYFEFHVKLRLAPDFDLKSINLVNGAQVSRNALKNNPLYQERFITLRLYKCGKESALNTLDILLQELNKQNLDIKKIIKEYSVYDSNVNLDQGWIPCGGCTVCPMNTPA